MIIRLLYNILLQYYNITILYKYYDHIVITNYKHYTYYYINIINTYKYLHTHYQHDKYLHTWVIMKSSKA